MKGCSERHKKQISCGWNGFILRGDNQKDALIKIQNKNNSIILMKGSTIFQSWMWDTVALFL